MLIMSADSHFRLSSAFAVSLKEQVKRMLISSGIPNTWWHEDSPVVTLIKSQAERYCDALVAGITSPPGSWPDDRRLSPSLWPLGSPDLEAPR